MRRFALIPFVLLAACGEPSFDERYDGAEQDIRERADEFEKDLDKDTLAEAGPASGGASR